MRIFTGEEVTAAPDEPRFDHDEAGTARGLLVSAGADLGGGDRVSLDSLMLPAELVSGAVPGSRDATVFHAFARAGAEPWAIERRAWYTRDAAALVDSLLLQAGHHLALGVISGFRADAGGADAAGFVRYRGQEWALAGVVLANGAAAIAVDAAGALPLIAAGA